MKNKFTIKLLPIIISFCILNCSEEDIKPDPIEASRILLAGKKGEGKTWKLIGIEKYSEISYGHELIIVSTCLMDNEYTFQNNNEKHFRGTEGDTKCTTFDPEVVEEGTWNLEQLAESDTFLTLTIECDSEFNSNTSNELLLSGGFSNPRIQVINLTENSLILRVRVSFSTGSQIVDFFNHYSFIPLTYN